MRKFVSAVLMLVMVLALVVTTQASAEASDKIKLKVMLWGSIAGKDEDAKGYMELNPELDAKYEIEYILGGAGDKDCMEKIRLALASRENLCDIVILNYTQIPELARAGALMDISEYYAPYEDKITEAGKILSQYEGKYIAAPSEVKTRVWFYRQDIFEECGVDVNAVKTTDDFIAAGLKIQEKYPEAKLFNLGRQACGYDFYLTLSGNGASFFDKDGNYNIASDAGVIACLQDYKKMIDAGIVSDSSDWTSDWENELASGILVSQPSAAWMGNKSFLPTYSAENAGKWACTIWPSFGGSTGGSDAGGQVWAVPVFSAHPEAAAEVICWMRLSEAANAHYFETRQTLTGVVNVDTLNSEAVKNTPNDFFGMSLSEAQTAAAGQFGVFNYSPNASTEQTIALEYFVKAIYGDMSIEDALSQAQDDMISQIGNAYE